QTQFPEERRQEYLDLLSAWLSRQRDIEKARNTNERVIRERFPEFSEISDPNPLTLADVQADVLDDDVLLLSYLFVNGQLFRWAIRKTVCHFDACAIEQNFGSDMQDIIWPMYGIPRGDQNVALERLGTLLLGNLTPETLADVTRVIILP